MLKLFFIVLFPNPSSGVVIRHDVPIQAYEELAAIEAFAGVAEIRVGSGFGGRNGSGVLVHDRWLLTAAHVVWGKPASEVEVHLGSTRIEAEEIRYPAAWSASPQTGLTQGSDLALIRLASSPGIAHSEIFTGNANGQVAILGGFGRTGNGILGAAGSSERMFAMNVIDRQFPTPNGGALLATDFDNGTTARNSLNAPTVRRSHYDAGFDDPLLTTTVLDTGTTISQATFPGLPTAGDFFTGLASQFLEGTTATGDSGGPLFVFDETTERWAVAGITSWGVNPTLPAGFARTDSRYGDVAFFTDLGTNANWIFANVPEPTSSLMITLSVGLLTLRRSRSRN